ncbi:MAG: enoyl-CoA hydratase/isomerase family protein, partial [Verrucomicrobiota bacterium]
MERTDQSTLHFSTFIARDFDERDVLPCSVVVARGDRDLSIRGSHMYHASQAAEVVRMLSERELAMEQEDLEITDLSGLPELQQKMLDGTMRRPKGVALVQADRPGRTVSSYEEAFRGEVADAADPAAGRFLDVRFLGHVAVVTLTRPEALNALSAELLSQLAALVREIRTRGAVAGKPVKALVLTGAGRAFVAGADVREFHGRSAEATGELAWKNISVFSELENLPLPVVALVDGYALGGGNELAMSAHYRIVTENALLGQPEVKLGIIPGYGGMQRLPRLIGPWRAAEMCVNGEPVDGFTAVRIGLADEFVPSAVALQRAVATARDLAEGVRSAPPRRWDEMAAEQQEELALLAERPEVRQILAASPSTTENASNLPEARRWAARVALEALRYGYEHGFREGLHNDAVRFGAVAASPGGQEWVGRFLAKDPAQSSFLEILPPVAPPVTPRPPITKKAPGDRPISFLEVGEIAAVIKEKIKSGRVTPLSRDVISGVIALLKERPAPPVLQAVDPSGAPKVGPRIASLLRRGKITVRVVDLDGDDGFRRENARPTCEVLLVEKDGNLLWEGKSRMRKEIGGNPSIFLAKAFLQKNLGRPHVVYQAIVHPILEWVFGYPHMIAVLSESAYNAEPPSASPGDPLSDLNRYIAESAFADRDFPYFDRILGDSYEPDDFRKEELANFFGDDEAKVTSVLERARDLGVRYRELVSGLQCQALTAIAREKIAEGRAALADGDADRALQILRKVVAAGDVQDPLRAEASRLAALAVRAYALGADPAFEGVTIARGEVAVDDPAGPRAPELAGLLRRALAATAVGDSPAPAAVAGGLVPRTV